MTNKKRVLLSDPLRFLDDGHPDPQRLLDLGIFSEEKDALAYSEALYQILVKGTTSQWSVQQIHQTIMDEARVLHASPIPFALTLLEGIERMQRHSQRKDGRVLYAQNDVSGTIPVDASWDDASES